MLLVMFGARRDASMSRRVVLVVDLMESSLLCPDRVVDNKVFGGEWVCVECVCGCVCLPLFISVGVSGPLVLNP